MDEEFVAKHGWLWTYQPGNSPLTNVKDACIFPAMSKRVSAEQGLGNGSRVLEGEQLWDTVSKAWESLPEETIARAYTGHHQIVNAIAACKGGDDFVRANNGLSFGIRKHCVSYFDSDEATAASGVTLVTEPVDDANEVVQQSGLKWDKPDLTNHRMEDVVQKNVLDFLYNNLKPTDEHWDHVAAALLVLGENET